MRWKNVASTAKDTEYCLDPMWELPVLVTPGHGNEHLAGEPLALMRTDPLSLMKTDPLDAGLPEPFGMRWL